MMESRELAPHAQAARARNVWTRMKDCAAMLAFSAGCANASVYESPRAPEERVCEPTSVYSLDNGYKPDRVMIGDEAYVVLRADVFIDSGKGRRAIVDYETDQGRLGLMYCWFVYQDIGWNQDGVPVHFLLNPRSTEVGEQRYIGALVSYPYQDLMQDMVVPVSPLGDDAANSGWRIPGPPKGRNGFLFNVYPDSFVPVMDGAFRAGDYCKETSLPEYPVPENGPTSAALAVYRGCPK